MTEKSETKIEVTKEPMDQVADKVGEEIKATKESIIDKAETTGEYIDDSVITLTVKTAILNDPMLNASHIEVTTVNGEVKLSGTVDSEQSIGRLVDVASSQKYVKSVQTDLTVGTSTR